MSEDEEVMTDSDEGNESEDISEEIEQAKNEDKLKFKVLTPKQIMEKPLELIKEVNEVLQVHPMIARQVLQYFGWNKENAVTRYTLNTFLFFFSALVSKFLFIFFSQKIHTKKKFNVPKYIFETNYTILFHLQKLSPKLVFFFLIFTLK